MGEVEIIMSPEYNIISRESIEAAEENEIIDLLPFLDKYFPCGHSKERYYNNPFAVAMGIIGKIYGNGNSRNKDYHKGIAYIAKELGISKRQVKALRKKYKSHKGYEFKTPFTIPQIVGKVIMLLQANESNDLVKEFVKTYDEDLYRTLLIKVEYEAIKIEEENSKKLRNQLKHLEICNIAGKLDNLTQKTRR